MKSYPYFLLIILYMLSLNSTYKKSEELSDSSLFPIPTAEENQFLQPLAGCDELGRVLPNYEDVGDIKKTGQ